MKTGSGVDPLQTLTPREREVLEFLRLGLSDAQIAERLGISRPGVSYHVSEIIGKLGVCNRHEAASWPERPPWWAAALVPVALLWRKATALSPVPASTVALAVSGGAFVAALSGLGLMMFLLQRADDGWRATNLATAPPAVRVGAGQALGDHAAPSPTDFAGTATPTETPELPARDGTSEPTPTPPVTSPSEPEPKSGDGAVDCDPSASGIQSSCSSAAGATPACPPERCASPTTAPEPFLTPAPAGPGAMAVDCDANRKGIQGHCKYEGGSTFKVQIHITRAPPRGYMGFAAEVSWDDSTLDYMLPSNPAAPDEVLWRPCEVGYVTDLRIDQIAPAVLAGCLPGSVERKDKSSTATGAILQFKFQCRKEGVTALALVPRDSDPAFAETHFFGYVFDPAAKLLVMDPELTNATVACTAPSATPTPAPL